MWQSPGGSTMPVIIATAETSGRPWFGGWTWAPLQWVLGFERLGLESYWVDRQGAIDPIKGPHSIDYAMDRFGRMASDFGFHNRWCVDYNHGEQYFGMDLWPARIDPRCQRFSTVADWRGSQCAIFQEEYYGTKREEFIRFLSVPQKAGVRIELALCIGQKDFEDIGLLDGHNWRLRDPYQ